MAGWLDVDTLMLLFGMMVLVGYLSRTGIFEYIAARVFSRAGRSPTRLVSSLCAATAILSAFLDNVTVILLMTGVTVSLCKSMGLPAERVVIATVIASNIGGAATLIGDPPNLMIASQLGNKGVTFGRFMIHVAPAVILSMMGTLCYFRVVLRADLSPAARKHRLLLQHADLANHGQLDAIERGANGCAAHAAVQPVDSRQPPTLTPHAPPQPPSLPSAAADDGPALSVAAIMSTGASARAAFEAQAIALRRRYPIRDRALLRVTAPIFGAVLVGFCLCSPLLQLEMAWIPIVGAGAVALLDRPDGLDAVLKHVEWSTLLFFGTLAVLMRGIGTLGLIDLLSKGLAHLIAAAPHNLQLPAALLVVLWGSAILSACVDNVPFTAAMIPVILSLTESDDLPLQPLVTALALGTCLGGNGSLIGASANIVAAGILEGLGLPISFTDFVRLSMPVTLLTICISSVYVLVLYVLIGVR